MIIIFHLLLTIALELLVYGFADRFRLKSVSAMLIANVILNLTMNILAREMSSYSSYIYFIIGAEIFTFITEAFVFFLFTNKKLWYCFLISFTANILSLAMGNIFNQTGLIYKNGVVYTITALLILVILSELFVAFFMFFRFLSRGLNNHRNESKTNEETDE